MGISENNSFKIKGYCEPFCGMLGVYEHMISLFDDKKIKYKAGDMNPYIIKLWLGLQKGWKPPTSCSKSTYLKYKENDDDSVKAIFCGYACPLRSRFRGTYMQGRNIKLQAEHCREIGKKVKNVSFSNNDYRQYSKLKGYIIYCDPPYENTACEYHCGDIKNDSFDTKKFIDWCLEMSKHNIIFVTEYKKLPTRTFKKLWTKGKDKLYVVNTKYNIKKSKTPRKSIKKRSRIKL